MKVLYVYAHPNPFSLNAALKNQALAFLSKQHIDFKISDLYADKFNALATWDDFNATETHSQYFSAQQSAYESKQLNDEIMLEINKIIWADHIIFQFPLWWFSMPAILKGWFDRVLVKGFAYDTGKIYQEGLLKNKTASLTITTQSPVSAYQQNGIHGAGIDEFLLPINNTLNFVGIKVLLPFVLYGADNLGMLDEIIKNYQDYLQKFT